MIGMSNLRLALMSYWSIQLPKMVDICNRYGVDIVLFERLSHAISDKMKAPRDQEKWIAMVREKIQKTSDDDIAVMVAKIRLL